MLTTEGGAPHRDVIRQRCDLHSVRPPHRAPSVPRASWPGTLPLAARVSATAQLVEHARGDDARGQGDDRDAHERGDHGDGAPHVGGGVEVAIADGRQGDDRPVDGVEEGVEGVRLDVENDEGADEDVADRQAEDGEQRLPLFDSQL